MGKQVYLIHGWGGNIGATFHPWLKKELEQRGYTVTEAALPHPLRPRIEEQLPYLQSLIQHPDAETILVGHSLGANLALRYLATLPAGTRIGKTILIAPAIDHIMDLDGSDDHSLAGPWLADTIDHERVKQAAGTLIAFFSDDDPVIPPSTVEIMKDSYGATVVIEHGYGHYSIDEHTTKVPAVLTAIIKA